MPIGSLPQYSGNDPNYYHGQAPQYSMNVQYDVYGGLLFFVIDGAIYDKEGFLIADNRLTENCQECLLEGITQVAITAVPGSCTKYYVIAGRTTSTGGAHPDIYSDLGYSILDMAVPNTRSTTCHMGHVISDHDAAMSDFTGDLDFFAEGGYANGFENFHLPDVFIEEEEGMQLAIHEPTAAGVPKRLFMVDESFVYVYDIEADGIHEVGHFTGAGYPSGPHMQNYATCAFGAGIDRPFAGAITTGENAAHEVLLAFTRSYLDDDAWPGSDPTYTTYYCKVTTTGQLQFIHNIETIASAPPGLDFNVPSLAFSPNGNYLYFTQSAAPNLGVVDLITYARTDLATALGITTPAQLGYGNLYLDKSPISNDLALYVIAPQRRGYLLNVDGPPANVTWTEGIPATGTINNAPTSIWAAEQGDTYALPDVHNRNERQIQNWQATGADPVCCKKQGDMMSWHPDPIIGSPNWTATSNPFGNNAVAYFNCDVIVQPGCVLTVNGMTWRFGPDAKLIIRPGGYAKFFNSTLTSYGCDYTRWPGVRVEGNKDARQTTYYQGKLYLGGSTVSNARIGVRCAKELPGAVDLYGYDGPVDAYGYGGILTTSLSTFRNCLTGADLGEYHHSPSEDPDIDDNASQFNYTHFETVTPMPDQTVPRNHLFIHGTRKVNVTNCSFANDATGFFWADNWGVGLYSYNAEVNVTGGTNQNYGFVRGLRFGILRSGNIHVPLTVNQMRFSGNIWGLLDAGGYFSYYVNNSFSVPDQGTALNKRVGMYLSQTRHFTVERNSFTGADPAIEANENSIGLFFYGIAPNPNGTWNYSAEQIYDNTFTDLYTGTLVNNVHVSHDAFSAIEGLQILCGDYTHNVLDIALGPTSLIRSDQGTPGGNQEQLAGNRFYHTTDPVNCSGIFDWKFDPHWNDILPYTTLVIDYHRHNVAECDVQCDAQVNYNQLTCLWDDYVGMQITFNKATDCGHGVLDNSHLIADVHADYVAARELAIGAQNLLDGTTDGGERPDLLADILFKTPWNSSGFLRDELMLNSPLSDEVLTTMIERLQPMDQWHITQVLLQNTPLNRGVVSALRASHILDDFFQNVVNQAQLGQGLSAKQLLERELVHRHDAQSKSLALLGWMWATDTVNTDGVDSLRNLILHDGGLDFTEARMEYLVGMKDFTSLGDELDRLRPTFSSYKGMKALQLMGAAYQGDWSQLTAAEVDSLTAIAEGGAQGAALIAGILYAYGLAEVVSEPIFPDMTKAMWAGREADAPAKAIDGLGAYPDPADDHTMLTYPAVWQGRQLELVDGEGRVVLSTKLALPGLMELRTADLAPGVYQARVLGTNGVGRLIVKH